jgi:hypothetical protein
MLEAPAHAEFNVTQTFALFSSILCWTLQRIRIPDKDIKTVGDRAVAGLRKKLERPIADDPWRMQTERVVLSAKVPGAKNFDGHDALRFLKNLRDAMAHGDARTVEPFNQPSRGGYQNLCGFLFKCAELDRNRNVTWSGEIALLESDMRHIGCELARIYCDALRGTDQNFVDDVRRHIRERAA